MTEFTEAVKSRGLNVEELERSAILYGKNTLEKKKRASFFRLFLKNLGDPVIKILLFALFLNIIFMIRGRDWQEGVGIALSVLLAAFISSFSEYKRDSAFEKLREGTRGEYKVERNGTYLSCESEELLLGDLIELSAGDKIPADCILLSGSLRVNQAPLTGESEEIQKLPDKELRKRADEIPELIGRGVGPDEISSSLFFPTPECGGAVFGGCFAVGGSAEARVFAVGSKTGIGQISESLITEEKSPLRERLDILAKEISVIGYISSALIAFAYLFNIFVIDSGFIPTLILERLSDIPLLLSSLFSAFTLALTVIVVAVPEGLPMMIAVVLAKNSGRMAKDNVLVRHAQGIEAAGCMNILFTDKTGTLTRGEPRVSRVITPYREFKTLRELRSSVPEVCEALTVNAVYNSDAVFSGGRIISKNPAERALLDYFKGGARGYTRISYTPFDSSRKYSSASVRSGRRRVTYLKGAPELILEQSHRYLAPDGRLLPLSKSAFYESISAHSREGERVILIAGEENSEVYVIAAIAMTDPLRRDAKNSVRELKNAGIQTVMITGDGRETAKKVAEDCGIIRNSRSIVISGSELDRTEDEVLSEMLPNIAVIYRALPSHKQRLVRIAKGKNLTVGMTGDGLNDAPALSAADCGFALGCGTEVSKDASDIVILDNRLSSVVNAVMHGRNIFKSIRKFITLQLIMNFTAMAVSMIGPFIGIESPVTVVQMLWINIVMDTLGGLAFAGEGADRRLLRERPKKRDEPVIDKATAIKVTRLSVFSSMLCIFFLKSDCIHSLLGTEEGSLYHLTAFFALFIFAGALNCFNARSEGLNIFAGISKNPTFISIIALVSAIQVALIYLGSSVVRTVPLLPSHLILTVLFAMPVLIFEVIWRANSALSKRKQ